MKTEQQAYEKFAEHAAAIAYAIVDDIHSNQPDLMRCCESLIRLHMSEYPASWQNWNFEKQAKKMLTMTRKIEKNHDWSDSNANLLDRYG